MVGLPRTGPAGRARKAGALPYAHRQAAERGRIMATARIEGMLRITPMLAEHADQVLAIYQAGIDEGDATFETAAPSWETFDAEKLPGHRLVAVDDASGRVLGWVAVARASARPAYAGVVEHSVYVHSGARGQG